jgi:hypothetical protein
LMLLFLATPNMHSGYQTKSYLHPLQWHGTSHHHHGLPTTTCAQTLSMASSVIPPSPMTWSVSAAMLPSSLLSLGSSNGKMINIQLRLLLAALHPDLGFCSATFFKVL